MRLFVAALRSNADNHEPPGRIAEAAAGLADCAFMQLRKRWLMSSETQGEATAWSPNPAFYPRVR